MHSALATSNVQYASRVAAVGCWKLPAHVLSHVQNLSFLRFVCTALQVDTWTSRSAPTFAYEFNDGAAPLRYGP